jgi:pSer/pThr/pTyr-binding forkhead associated (FHA) protein
VQDASNAPARLVVIHPDGTEGDTFSLGHNETTIGRSHPAPLFAEDPFLSPRHATFYFVKGQLFARDEGSLNGVFVRIKAEVELFHGDYFRIGQQLLRFEEMAQVRPVMPGAGDGTMVMGSPLRGAWGRLSSIVALNTPATVWVLRRPEEQLGRERGDITFPEDGFVSGAHCKLAARDSRFFLQDLGSTNGSYLRVKAEGILSQGDLILLGQQLFRVELNV